MKLVNPVGRSVMTGSNSEITPRACMCNSNFVSARGNDGCFKCGFNCRWDDPQNHASNQHIAYWTIRKS